ncbi:hypothetical protein E4U33_002559, partial [Claviceps sp. LM78 group G4]
MAIAPITGMVKRRLISDLTIGIDSNEEHDERPFNSHETPRRTDGVIPLEPGLIANIIKVPDSSSPTSG